MAEGVPADAQPPDTAPDAVLPLQPRKCRYCAADMPEKARFCRECELFQRRFMRSKSTVGYFTLLNAMIATMLVAMTFLIEKLPEWDLFASSDPVPVGFTCYRNQAFLTITNRGRRMVTIEGGTVTAMGLGESAEVRRLRIDPRDAIIGKGSAQVVGMTFLDPKIGATSDFIPPSDDGEASAACKYVFAIRYQDFQNGELRELQGIPTCDCAMTRFSSDAERSQETKSGEDK
ncbi:hypothetical protein P1X14_11890 [Sphingomonas sp. AOB5]|uniref:hypothetical protein n=1 Tax=Sphingomonas sp. AOB5 TaxID=3034017 RepID=UPI0023F7229B|nr:hypothetical protein [Sphingomonas sp. AOB5]MDF7775949.1 hypothetical protein [Sphingomonas sp. AOB5]